VVRLPNTEILVRKHVLAGDYIILSVQRFQRGFRGSFVAPMCVIEERGNTPIGCCTRLDDRFREVLPEHECGNKCFGRWRRMDTALRKSRYRQPEHDCHVLYATNGAITDSWRNVTGTVPHTASRGRVFLPYPLHDEPGAVCLSGLLPSLIANYLETHQLSVSLRNPMARRVKSALPSRCDLVTVTHR
jgi:hypothetical protein